MVRVKKRECQVIALDVSEGVAASRQPGQEPGGEVNSKLAKLERQLAETRKRLKTRRSRPRGQGVAGAEAARLRSGEVVKQLTSARR